MLRAPPYLQHRAQSMVLTKFAGSIMQQGMRDYRTAGTYDTAFVNAQPNRSQPNCCFSQASLTSIALRDLPFRRVVPTVCRIVEKAAIAQVQRAAIRIYDQHGCATIRP